jgi:hypothetical protein
MIRNSAAAADPAHSAMPAISASEVALFFCIMSPLYFLLFFSVE